MDYNKRLKEARRNVNYKEPHKDIIFNEYPDEVSIKHFGDVPSYKKISDRMASTIRHNRARGTHDIELMTNIVSELVESGMTDNWILKHIGMDADELLRLKQITGLQQLFKDEEFSKSWEVNYE